MSVLISACLIPSETGAHDVTMVEYGLYFCVFARICIDVDQVIQQGCKRYFRNFWNYVDMIVIGLLVVAAFYKGFLQYTVKMHELQHRANKFECCKLLETLLKSQHRNSMNVNYIYAVAEFILTLRLMSLLEVHKSLGTMLIALKYLLFDVLKFGIILLMVILGTSIAIYSMTISLEEWNQELSIKLNMYWPNSTQTILPENIKIPEAFESFTDTIRSILWGTFGLLEVVSCYFISRSVPSDQVFRDNPLFS